GGSAASGNGANGNGAGRGGYPDHGSGRNGYGIDPRAAYPGTEAAAGPGSGSDYPSRSSRAGTREYVNRSGGAPYRSGSDPDGWGPADPAAVPGEPGGRTGLARRAA